MLLVLRWRSVRGLLVLVRWAIRSARSGTVLNAGTLWSCALLSAADGSFTFGLLDLMCTKFFFHGHCFIHHLVEGGIWSEVGSGLELRGEAFNKTILLFVVGVGVGGE